MEKKARDSGAAASAELVSALADDLDVHIRLCGTENPPNDQGLSQIWFPSSGAPPSYPYGQQQDVYSNFFSKQEKFRVPFR